MEPGSDHRRHTQMGRCPFRAQLFGGNGDGLLVELPRLDPTIIVFQNGGLPFAVESDAEAVVVKHAQPLGKYELVEPVGPETPVYIPAP